MRREQLREGDLVRIKLPACRSPFEARIEGFDEDGRLRIDPVSSWVTWYRVKLGDVAERIDPPPRKHRRQVTHV